MVKSRALLRLVVVAAAAIVLLPSPRSALCQVAGTEGIEQGERFAKAGDQAVRVIVEAKDRLKMTLDAYNSLVSMPSRNPKADYRKLLKNLGYAKEKIAVAKPKIDAMNFEGEAYFKMWANQIANIGDADLKARGDERIASTRKEYDGILATLREAATALDPFLQDLTDQANFLGSDLRPEALASLKTNAEKLNAKAKTLFTPMDASVSSSEKFFAPLRTK
jgi:hypothetical protein